MSENDGSSIGAMCFTRKIGASIMIGDDIEIKPVRSDGNQVRIVVIAPKTVRILRKELWDANQTVALRD